MMKSLVLYPRNRLQSEISCEACIWIQLSRKQLSDVYIRKNRSLNAVIQSWKLLNEDCWSAIQESADLCETNVLKGLIGDDQISISTRVHKLILCYSLIGY